MRADRHHFADLGRAERLDILLGDLGERQIVTEPPRRIAGAFFLPEDAEGDARMPQDARQRQNDVAALRVIRAHAAEPQAILLRSVVDGELVLLDEFGPLTRGEAE